VPRFFFHLGDIVYNFGEDNYYYDQFFDPFRDYDAPILAIPGNHDGEVYPGDPSGTLQAFLKVFCASRFQRLPEAGGLSRTSMIVAMHHPTQVVGRHASSPAMLKQMDACFASTGVYPHAVFSGHAHNYQRYARLEGNRQTPYIVAGMGGHSSEAPFGKLVSPPRTHSPSASSAATITQPITATCALS
jgi:predicted phosphodiesterase